MRPAELLTLAAWLLGWLLVTGGVAAIVAGHLVAAVWLLSLGLLAVGLGGFRLLAALLWHGAMEAYDAEKQPTQQRPRSSLRNVRLRQ